jgi:hypothetical protein
MGNLGDLITKKGKKKESTAPVLAIGDAEVRFNSAEFLAAGDEVTKKDGICRAPTSVAPT